MKRFFVATLLLAAALPAAAADYYVGYGPGATFIDLPAGARVTGPSLTAHVGHQITERYGVELRTGFTSSGHDTVAGERIEVGVDWFVSAFSVIHGRPGRALDPYLLLGGTTMQLKGGADESAFSAGLGVQVRAGDMGHVRVEYVHYLEENGMSIGGANLLFSFPF